MRTQKTSSVQGAALGDKEVGSWPWSSRLLCDLGQVSSLLWASVCPCVKQGGETHSFGSLFLRCICGSWVLPGHPQPDLGLFGWAVQAGQAGGTGKNRAAGPNVSLRRSSPLAVLYSVLAPGQLLGAGVPAAPPREGVSQSGRGGLEASDQMGLDTPV